MPHVIIVTKDQAGEKYSLWRTALDGVERKEWEQRQVDGLTVLSSLTVGDVEVQQSDGLSLPFSLKLGDVKVLRERTEEEPSTAGDLFYDVARFIGAAIKNLTEGERLLIAAHGATYSLVRPLQQPGRVWVRPLTHESGANPYEAVLQYLTAPSPENCRALCDSIRSSLPFDKRVCNVQHSLNRLFSALVLDLEMWRDEGAASEEARDVFRKHSKSQEIRSLPASARRYVYGPAPRPKEAIADIIAEAKAADGINLTPWIIASLDRVQALIPQDDLPPELSSTHKREYERSYSLFSDVFGDGKIVPCIKNISVDDGALDVLWLQIAGGNPVQEWRVALNDALDDLRRALSSTNPPGLR